MSPNDHQDLISQLLDGEADDASRAKLADALKRDPNLREEFRLHLRLSEALDRIKPERQEDTFVRSTIGHVLSLAPENELDFTRGVARKITRRTWTKRISIAAAITLAATAAVFSVRLMKPTTSIATMIELDDHGRMIHRRDIIPGYHQSVEKGLFRINFDNGATVAIEGPADFKVESSMRMHLHAGKLNAWCPERAHGFQVVTATGTVTDLGTSFGVTTNKDGASEFMVLDGLIEVTQGSSTRRLEEGQAVRTAMSAGIEDLEFQPAPFTRTWPLASGILSTSGSVKPAPPGTAEQLSKLESNDTVMVIPEKRNVIFDQPIQAELTQTGTFSAKNPKQLHTIQDDPEKRLRSFLVRFNPVYNIDFKRLDGEVTFDRPVLAICCQGRYLDATDEMFATGQWTDVSEEARKFRGIDLDQPARFPEEVTLSEDRRTVKILFNAGVSSDDIRVILEEH